MNNRRRLLRHLKGKSRASRASRVGHTASKKKPSRLRKKSCKKSCEAKRGPDHEFPPCRCTTGIAGLRLLEKQKSKR